MTGQQLVLRGAFIGSIFVGILCCVATASAASLEKAIEPMEVSPTPWEAVTVDCKVSEEYPPSILQWCDLITSYAEQASLSPDLIAAVIWQESGGNPLAYSHSGAVGLMQVMPRDGIAASFQCVNGPCFASRPTTEELQNPEYNIRYGTRMLAGLVKRQGSLRDGLRSYGPMDMGYRYADQILAIYETYGGK